MPVSMPPNLSFIDLTVPIRNGGWHYDEPYFAPEIWSIESPPWVPGTLYAEAMRIPLQTGTYIESAAHSNPQAPKISEYPLQRTVLLPTVCLNTPTAPRTGLTAERVDRELDRLQLDDTQGYGLIINTGWADHLDESDFTTECPFFEDDVADVIIERGFTLIGSDTPRYENPDQPQGHIRRMFDRDILLLSPLINLGTIGTATGRLIVAPLIIEGAAATPTRAVWVPDGTGLQP